LFVKGLSNNKVCRSDEAILLFFETQNSANSLRLFANFATKKNGKRASQNAMH
jgi:hypothetical protein